MINNDNDNINNDNVNNNNDDDNDIGSYSILYYGS